MNEGQITPGIIAESCYAANIPLAAAVLPNQARLPNWQDATPEVKRAFTERVQSNLVNLRANNGQRGSVQTMHAAADSTEKSHNGLLGPNGFGNARQDALFNGIVADYYEGGNISGTS